MKNCTRIALYNAIQTYSTISDFANIFNRVSYTIAKSLKILELANNNVQRYTKLSTPVDKTLHQDSTVQYKHTAQSVIYNSIYAH